MIWLIVKKYGRNEIEIMARLKGVKGSIDSGTTLSRRLVDDVIEPNDFRAARTPAVPNRTTSVAANG